MAGRHAAARCVMGSAGRAMSKQRTCRTNSLVLLGLELGIVVDTLLLRPLAQPSVHRLWLQSTRAAVLKCIAEVHR